MGLFARLFDGFSTLIFPRLCLSCRLAIDAAQQEGICLRCQQQLGRTDNWQLPENEMTDLLAGRLRLTHAAALYVYKTPSPIQEMIHALKYYHRPEIGRRLGLTLGQLLARQPHFAQVDAVVPVPIHDRRRTERGYNQAELIAEGIGQAMDRVVLPHLLLRTDFRGSQTKRGRLERLENVRESFAVNPATILPDGVRHLLLVDDVMTTGATLDFCGNALLAAYPEVELSIATLALARLG